MIGQTISHYRILSQLGEGGMGAVYLAEDTRLGRRVAIKIPHAAPDADNSYHARFLREARSVSQLSHPHIAAIFDYGETPEGRPFIVMELVEGRELGDILRGGGLTMTRAVEIVCEVAEALSEAHRRGIVHRDIKPSNVVVNGRGEVKVLDFGLAKLLEDEQESVAGSATPEAETLMKFRTHSNVMLGTPLYLSPEQARGSRVDPRSDLFALGALLYECLAGRPAFSGSTVMEIAAQIIHVDPPPPSSLNPSVTEELDRATLKALAKRPEARYQTAEEMIDDLRAAGLSLSDLGGDAAAATPHHAARTARMPREPSTQARASAMLTLSDNLRRPRLSIAAAAAVVLVVLGGLWVAARMLRPEPHKPKPEAEDLHDRGVDLLREGAFWQASKTLRRAVEVDDRYALAHARLAEAWTEVDYGDRAKDEMLRVNQLVPDRSILSDRDRLYLEAVTSTVTRDFAGSIRAYEEIARRWPAQAHAHLDLGRAYEKAEDPKRAIESYLRATERNSQYATAYLRVGTLYARQQEYASAEKAFDRAEEIYNDTGQVEGRTEVLFRRGFMLRGMGKLAEARAQLQQALEIARTNSYEPKRINILLQLSAVATNENNHEQASAYAREAVELAQANGLDNLAALALIDLGNTYWPHGEYAEGEKYLRQGLASAERNNAQRVRAKALINLGSLHIQKGETDEGVRLVEQAVAFYRPNGYSKEAASGLSMLGRANRQKGNYAEALKIFEQQLELAGQVSDLSQAAQVHHEIATIYGQQDRYADALRHFEASHQIDRAQGHQLRLNHNLLGRADMLWSLGRYDEARPLLDQVPGVADKPDAKNKELVAERHLSAAGMALSERRFDQARSAGAQALALVGDGNKKILVRAKLTLARAQALSGGAQAARAVAEQALAAARAVGDPWLLSNAQLALAEVLVEAGDAAGALAHAREAQESFARSGRRESEWRAWLVAARASLRGGDAQGAREQAERAARVLAEIQQTWGAEAFNSYQSRPDVQLYRRQLAELSSGARPV